MVTGETLIECSMEDDVTMIGVMIWSLESRLSRFKI